MQPFNIDKFRAGAKVITRDGREVKQLTEFKDAKKWKLIGVIDQEDETTSWTIDRDTWGPDEPDDNDLLHPETEMWVNVYKSPTSDALNDIVIHPSKEKALAGKVESDYIGTFKLVRDDT
jgi:hypothetical protein